MELKIDKGTDCKSSSNQIFKIEAKNRLDDLQGIFSDLRSASKESRADDVAVLEEQVHQMLREWKAELNEPTPQNSSQRRAAESFSETLRMLNLSELDDDATSKIEELVFGDPPKLEQVGLSQPGPANAQDAEINLSVDDNLSYEFSGKEFLYAEHYEKNIVRNKGVYQYENNPLFLGTVNCLNGIHSDYQQYNFYQEREPNHYYPAQHIDEEVVSYMSDKQAILPPSPAAFLGPKTCPKGIKLL